MPRDRVKSSVIAAVGYDEPNHRLEVEFHNGRLYDYFDVPRTAYEALLTADSVGTYFNEVIRPHYRSSLARRTRDEEEHHPAPKIGRRSR